MSSACLAQGRFLTTELNNGAVPWSLVGAMLFNLVTGLATCSVFHRKLSPIQRVENCLTSFVLLDLCELAAVERGRLQKIPKCRLWIAARTQQNLQELCGAIVIAACSLRPGEIWAPWRSTELPIEQHFGHIRCGSWSHAQRLSNGLINHYMLHHRWFIHVM